MSAGYSFWQLVGFGVVAVLTVAALLLAWVIVFGKQGDGNV